MPIGQRIRRANPTRTSIGMPHWCARLAICRTCIISIGIELSFDAGRPRSCARLILNEARQQPSSAPQNTTDKGMTVYGVSS